MAKKPMPDQEPIIAHLPGGLEIRTAQYQQRAIAHLPGGFELRDLTERRSMHSPANGQFVGDDGSHVKLSRETSAGWKALMTGSKGKPAKTGSSPGKSKSLAELHFSEADTHNYLAKHGTEHEKVAHSLHADAHAAAAHAHKTGKKEDHEAAHQAWGAAIEAHKKAGFHAKTQEAAKKHHDFAAAAERDRQGHG